MTSSSTPTSTLHALFGRQRDAFLARHAPVTAAERIDRLRRLESLLLDNRHRLADALNADFNGRSKDETAMVEIFGTVDDIRHTCRHVKDWMKTRRADSNWAAWPGNCTLRYEPLGVVGVMSSFNYPVYLSLSPAVGALAAGNHVMIKPSELTPVTSQLLQTLIAENFAPEILAAVPGDLACAQGFSALPFNHLLFTGSTRVGKLVMRAAAENLTPVTLELGGKSPTIIDRDYPLESAVKDIIHAKLLNAGQTCIAPDHVFVPEESLADFIAGAKRVITGFYPSLVSNPDYTRIVSNTHWLRLKDWCEEAQNAGALVEMVNPAAEICDNDNRVFPPTLVRHCPADTELMRQEIFGPVLPVVGYQTLDEVSRTIRNGATPLALYFFSRNSGHIERLLESTPSGGVTLNGCLYHVAQHRLPLGGVGNSGMGRYHGFDGFETFSHKRGVFHASRLNPTSAMHPPYTRVSRFVIDRLLRR